MKYEQRNEIEQGLTDKQLKTLLRMLLMIVKKCKDKDEIIKKIEELLMS